MKSNKTPRWLIVLVLVLFICIGVLVLQNRSTALRWQLASLLYDNNLHLLPCEDLPSIDEVRQVMSAYQGELEQIQAVHSEIYISVDESCPGKGSLRIEFPGHAQREQIEAIVNGKTFFGIPYSLINT